MTQFTDLPNEIVAQIAQNIHPHDIVNFSSTSKFIHSVSEPSLKVHHEMKRSYKELNCFESGIPLADVLDHMISQPTAALYVECLAINTWSSYRSRLLYHDESGDEGPVLALLLMRLPGITTLKLNVNVPLKRLLKSFGCRLEAPGVPFLSTLTTLYLEWDGIYGNQGWEIVSYFATLPSLRSMAIKHFDFDQWDVSAYLLQPRSSNVTSIMIENSHVHEQPLLEFLQAFKHLRRFSYQSNLDTLDPDLVRTALLAHCKASLEYLSLLTDLYHCMGSLRDFESLKEVITEKSHLLGEWYLESQVLGKVLPVSVEKVHLREDEPDTTPKDIQNVILNAAKDKHEHLPNLQELRVSLCITAEALDLEDDAAIVHMQAKCKEAGFKLTIDCRKPR